MKYTLKDYQAEAVDLLLDRLERAQSDYRERGTRSSVSLCATTGAGKTVMAAAVIEALFNGSDEFEPDDGAVVVWFSDDPSLNEQTKNRLLEASDKLTRTDLVTIEPPFSQPRLDPGKVYFLNTQKLSVTSKLTRGTRDDADPNRFEQFQAPDDQAWTIWDTLNDTILDDELTLYLFLDEAHRGFGGKSTSKDKSTIVKRLVNGSSVVTAAPIVVGISATIGKFATAMTEAEFLQDRQALEPVNVDGARVQESGLLKDTVVLDFTTEAGVFDRALVRRAAQKLKASTEAWAEYAASQKDPNAAVSPLLVLQIPNKPDHDLVGGALDVINDVIPSVTQEAVRHVLGEHSAQEFGSWTVNWIEPQAVQDRTDVRVLVAKEAISTGWDCPRAEVMVSFRTAKEHTHITQILGRMVRNPLARRVPGDDRLNSVDCLLPYFDRTTAGKVVKLLTGQIADIPGASKKVLLDGREMTLNPKLKDDEELWDAWRAMPTQLLPQRGVRPVSRLLQFATELANDGLRPTACQDVEAAVLRELDACAIRYDRKVDKARGEVLTIHGQSIAGTTGEHTLTYSEFTMHADDQAVAVAFKDAKAAFSDVARAFVNRQVQRVDDEFTNPIRDAMVECAALATVQEIRETVDATANALFDKWDYKHASAIEGLGDLRRDSYREIKAQAPDPQVTSMIRPRVRLEDFQELDANEQMTLAPTAPKHLMSDDLGNFPLSRLNAWERKVVLAEVAKPTTVAWYRNPPRSAGDSLCVAYRNEFGNWRGMYPDFVFFEQLHGRLLPSLVDPHRYDLDDAMLKVRALADFAEQFGHRFHRIESLAEVNGKMHRLDLKSGRVRKDVQYWEGEVVDLYVKAGELIKPSAAASVSPSTKGGQKPDEAAPLFEG